jgi:hypothetical protein
MGDVSWRAARPSDAEALAALFQTIERTAPIGLETEPAEIVSRLSRPGLDLGRDSLMMVDHTGAAWAYAETADMGVGQGQFRIRLTSAIHPDADGEALRRTHDWLMHRATELHGARRPDLPGAVGARCAATDHSRLTLLTDLGFEVVGWHRNLVRPVDRPLPPAPTGIVVVAYDAGYDELVRLAHNDAYADSPAALLPDARSWHSTPLGDRTSFPTPHFSPSRTRLRARTSRHSCSVSDNATTPASAPEFCTAWVPASPGADAARPPR